MSGRRWVVRAICGCGLSSVFGRLESAGRTRVLSVGRRVICSADLEGCGCVGRVVDAEATFSERRACLDAIGIRGVERRTSALEDDGLGADNDVVFAGVARRGLDDVWAISCLADGSGTGDFCSGFDWASCCLGDCRETESACLEVSVVCWVVVAGAVLFSAILSPVSCWLDCGCRFLVCRRS